MDVSIIIVSFNTRDLTLEAVRSARQETTRVASEIVVVDNASKDGSADALEEHCPGIRLIRLAENIGFGPGNNEAAKHATGDYLLLLNPDTITQDHAIDRLVEFARSHPEHRIYGGRTLFPDGSLNPASAWGRPSLWSMFCRGSGLGSIFKGSRWFDPEALGDWGRDTIREVPIISGCFLMIERRLWDDLGGFDERFRMYAEEFDLCLRAGDAGIQPIAFPEATIVHYGGASERVAVEATIRQYQGRARLVHKHWPRWKARLGVRCLDLWAVNKFLRAAALSPFSAAQRKLTEAHWEIVSRRLEWHQAGLKMAES